MKTQRFWTVTTLCWLFAFFNIERVFPQVDIASFVYGLATLVGVAVLASPFLRRLPFGLVTAFFGILWIVGKCLLGYGVHLNGLPIALVELYSLVVTQFLCLRVARHTDEFVLTSTQMLDVLKATSIPTLKAQESVLLEEIRRARRHERPLTFMTLTPGQANDEAIGRLVQKLTESLTEEYLVGGISRILGRETKSHDLAVRVGDQILMVLPETDAGQAAAMSSRLRERVSDALNIPLSTQTIAFGTDELTLSGVLDRMGLTHDADAVAAADVFELRATKLGAATARRA